MKTKTFLIFNLIFCLSLGNLIIAQNITNTLGSSGTFYIKDGSSTFLKISQQTGNVSLLRNMELGSTSTSTSGVITKNGFRFLHNYGTENTFLGENSGNFTMTGGYNTAIGYNSFLSNTNGSGNSAIGYSSLYSNTTGYRNSALGYFSLYSNTAGYSNSAFGVSSLYSNTNGYQNSAFGDFSMQSNTTGYQNSAFGHQSLKNNTLGYQNSAFGLNALLSNKIGMENSAFGNEALSGNLGGQGNSAFGWRSLVNNTYGFYNSAFGNDALIGNFMGEYNSAFGSASLLSNNGNRNSAFGVYALYTNLIGSNNVAVGFEALRFTTGSNNIGIGSGTVLPSENSSNQVRIGNTLITYAGIQVAWTITSDRNLKSNIYNSNLGLGFINKLRPVSYIRKNDESGKTEYGLIAQEVEETLKEEGVENTAMLTVTDSGEYQLRYNDLLAPMIKAIQELKAEKDTEITSLKKENEILRAQLNEIRVAVNKIKQNHSDVKEVKLGK